MSLLFDIHLHTQRHSSCSRVDAQQLIGQAIKVGLDGLVLTEHHYQWSEEELQDLKATSGVPGFTLLAGFEYSSCAGDILIYGLSPEQAALFPPYEEPEGILAQAQALGGFCIAAHPTREGLGFDERILQMPFDAMEVRSRNLKPHEQRLALKLSENLAIPAIAASDAHRLQDVGAYALELDSVIHSIADLRDSIKSGKFRMVDAAGS